MKSHMAVTQFPVGTQVLPDNFKARNRTMALLSDASMIIEAGETGGAISHGWEAIKMGHQVFLDGAMMGGHPFGWMDRMVRRGARFVSCPEEVVGLLAASP